MKIIKRNKTEVYFNIEKISAAVTKANNVVEEAERLTPLEIRDIAESVQASCEKMNRALSVEEIQDFVEKQIMAHGAYEVARHYITYRYRRSLVRQSNTTDDSILSLIECNNEEVKQENSNKDPRINSVQRDYMAGEVSRDYYAQHVHNCSLVNLEDMLQNGTVISGTRIDKPKSFSTACNIATQIIAQVASCQYGGQSVSLTHLAPFVQISREKITASIHRELTLLGIRPSAERIALLAEERPPTARLPLLLSLYT